MAKYLGIPLQVASGTTVTPTYGSPELVVDGDFPLPNTDWVTPAGWSVSSNSAIYNGSGVNFAKLYQPLNTTIGVAYKLTFTISGISGGTVRVGLSDSSNAFNLGAQDFTINDTYSITVLAETNTDRVVIQATQAAMLCTISNVSVKEVSSVLGKEQVINGDFSNGTTLGWTFENLTAVISNNTLKLTSTTATENRAYYNISTEVGKTYQMSADVKSGASNSELEIGAIGATSPANFQDGANAASFTNLKFVFTATLTTTEIRLLNSKKGTWGGLDSIVEFDNVSVKEVQYNYLQVVGGDLLKESKVGDVVFNSTDDNEAVVVQVIDNDTLLLSNDVLSDAEDSFSIFAPNGDTRGNQILRIDNYIISEYDEASSLPDKSSFWFAAGIEADKVTLTQLNDAVNTYFVADVIERFVQRLNAQSATASRLDIPLNEFRDHKYNQVLTTTAITLS
tara:strand:+ start:186 stop:1541 length:1356 start_codon:yes stop_codon:yes gene_type:complete